jgi:hypothetical protein
MKTYCARSGRRAMPSLPMRGLDPPLARTAARVLAFLASVALILVGLPRLYGLSLFNAAELARVHGTIQPAFYAESVRLLPDNDHVRYQAGAGLFAAGLPGEAAATLQPLAARRSVDPAVAALLVGSLVAAGQPDQALRVYTDFRPEPPIADWIAAGLVSGATFPALDSTLRKDLLAQVFGLDTSTPDFQTFVHQTGDPAFWAGAAGQRTGAALAWAGQPPPEDPSGDIRPDGAVLAGLLGSGAGTWTLGPEQIVNGGFELPSMVNSVGQGWHRSFMSTGRPWNFALFVVGADRSRAYEGRAALRVEGVQIEQQADREPARAGLWHSAISVPAGAAYSVSFAYTTRGLADNGASFWLSDQPLLGVASDHYLAASEGQWREVTVVAWNRSGKDAAIAPLVRAWGQGSLWVDAVSVRLLSLPQAIAPRPPVVDVRLAGRP